MDIIVRNSVQGDSATMARRENRQPVKEIVWMLIAGLIVWLPIIIALIVMNK
jgi:hypothetical protein